MRRLNVIVTPPAEYICETCLFKLREGPLKLSQYRTGTASINLHNATTGRFQYQDGRL